MAWYCDIRIVDENGRPHGGRKVTVMFGFLHGWLDEYTNSDGWAHFSSDYLSGSMSVESVAFDVGGFLPWPIRVAEDLTIDDGDSLSFTVTKEDWEG